MLVIERYVDQTVAIFTPDGQCLGEVQLVNVHTVKEKAKFGFRFPREVVIHRPESMPAEFREAYEQMKQRTS